MSALDLVRFSAGALRGHRLRTGLCLLGVAIGVASVIVLTSLGEGARQYVTGEFASLGTNLLIVTPGKTETTGGLPVFGGVPNDLTLADAEAIERFLPRVRRVAPLSMGEAPARYGTTSREVTVGGTTADFIRVRGFRVQLGRYLPEGVATQGQRVCVIGADIRRLVFGGANPLGEWLRLGDERYRVIGVMAPRGTSLGMDLDEVVHVPVRTGMRMFNRSGLFQLYVEVRSHEEIPEAKQAVIDLLRERHDGIEDVTVTTQDAMLSTFGRILTALTAALGAIGAVSLSVAGIGIMNVMLVSVSERTAEIGLLKALGAGRGQILAVFLVEAAIISTLGGLLGLGTGIAVDEAFMRAFPDFEIAPPDWAVTASLLLSVLVGVGFGALPARRASRLDPVQALAGR